MNAAMILAAGYGKRLRPYTELLPKGLVFIDGRPTLEWIVKYLNKFSISKFRINSHYLADTLENYAQSKFNDLDVKIFYEESILGTGGGILNACLEWNRECLIYNSDIICDIDLNRFKDFHESFNSSVSLVGMRKNDANQFIVDEDRNLCGMSKNGLNEIWRKPIGEIITFGFCGIHLLETKVLNLVDEVHFSIIDIYKDLVNKGETIKVWEAINSNWFDTGTINELCKAEQFLRSLET